VQRNQQPLYNIQQEATMKNAFLTLSSGYIIMFFSEQVFWARYRPGQDTPGDLLLTWLAYSLVAYVFLCAIRLFRVRQLWALFLCGALVGWLTEGVIVQTMYADFPINLAWTGLAWHALISVMFGWYALRRVLLQNNPPKTILVVGLAGLMWGTWAISWWSEDPITRNSPVVFAAFAFVITGLLIASEWVSTGRSRRILRPTGGFIGYLWLAGIEFRPGGRPGSPHRNPDLAALISAGLFTLWRNRQNETSSDLIENLRGSIRPTNYAALLGIPAAAAIVYTLAGLFRLEAPTNYVVFILTTIAGIALFIMSLIKTLKQNTG
jgi:hypothetical protein